MTFDRAREHAQRLRPPVTTICDRCGLPLRRLHHAAAFLRYDIDDRLVEAVVIHNGCAAARRREIDSVEHAEVIPADDVDAEVRERLRATARAHEGGSIARLFQKLRKLARGTS